MPKTRFGVDVFASGGPFVSAGGGLRYERHVGGQWVLMGRTMASGIALLGGEAEHDFFALTGHIGARRYSSKGSAYVSMEAGLVVYRRASFVLDDVEPARWGALPSTQLGVGFKAGPVDVGAAGLLPWLGVVISLGVDLY